MPWHTVLERNHFILTADALNRSNDIIEYMGTPSGIIKHYYNAGDIHRI